MPRAPIAANLREPAMTMFDTLKATKRLIAAGVDARRAEAHAETLRATP